MPEPTHIVFTYPSQDTEIMFRASDGMMIAERQKCTLVFGEDPSAPFSSRLRKQSRVFIESDPLILPDGCQHWNTLGSRYMREIVANNDLLGLDPCTQPCTERTAVIEERCQEGSVILAPDSLDMRTNGGGMQAVDMKAFNKSLKTN
jgi:hypothetical protein